MDNLGFGIKSDGFEGHNLQELEELNKALTVGHEYADTLPGAMVDGAVHQYESLDKTLRLVTYEMKNLKFWPDVPKDQAYNTVEEFDVQNSYGNNASAFFTMGNAPVQRDSSYSRHVAKVKYVGTQGSVHHNLTLVRPAHGPVIAREIKNKTMYLLGTQERFLFEAAESINTLEYDGIGYQIEQGDTNAKFQAQAFSGYDTNESVVYDLRGQVLDEDLMEDISLRVLNNFGFPTDMYLDTKAHSDFSKTFFPKQRIAAPGTQVRGGITVPDFQSSAGVFSLKSTVFRRPRRGYLTVADNTSAPAAPTFSVQPAAAPAAGSQFIATDIGSYYYVASAFNEYGESAGTASNVVPVTTGDGVTFTLADQVSTYGFMIFRSAKDGAATTAEFVKRVIKGTTTTAVADLNADMPGLSKAYLMKMDADNVMFKQLAPMMKLDLAVVGTAFRWMQLHYGMPMLFTPRFNVEIKNIGRATS
ncbi:hypothetical protein KY333_05120 [Candidatus Woesearchaeota archaeon]|nr:hypothetical protein [Candidatus Woesearchaeota archaeon]